MVSVENINGLSVGPNGRRQTGFTSSPFIVRATRFAIFVYQEDCQDCQGGILRILKKIIHRDGSHICNLETIRFLVFMFIIFWPFSIHTIMMMMMMILVSVCVNVEVSWRPLNAQSGARSKGQPGQVFLKRSRRWEILCFWQLHRHIGAQSCPEWIFWWSRSNYLKAGYLMIGINGEGQRSTKYTITN